MTPDTAEPARRCGVRAHRGCTIERGWLIVDTNDERRAVSDFRLRVTADLRYRAAYVLHGPDGGPVESVEIDADALWLEACRIVSMAWELRQLERFGRRLLEHGNDLHDVCDYMQRTGHEVVAQVVDGTIDTIDTFAGSTGIEIGAAG